jgi:hypothetical protein
MRRPHVSLRQPLGGRSAGARHQMRSSAALLGWDHPLVRGEGRRADLRRQSLVTAPLMVGSGIAAAFGSRGGLLLFAAAAIVQLALGVGLFVLARMQLERACDLIISGQTGLPLPVVENTLRRLASHRRRASLAGSLEGLVRTAERWPTLFPTTRPVFDPRLIRVAASDLRWIAARLREPAISVAAVARVERLLTGAGSPLYGREGDKLQQELTRIRADFERVDRAETEREGG